MSEYFIGKTYSFSIKILHEKIYELLSMDKRLDERDALSFREIDIKTKLIEKADGSAIVSLGKTKVIAGIKHEIEKPFPDRPKEGVFVVNAELLPLASKSFEPGPPDERGVELARIVDRCIRESKAIDLQKLCLIEGESVYSLFIDLYILDYDGNYFDPSVLAAVAALSVTDIPIYKVENGKIIKTEERMKIPMKDFPVSVTLGIIKDKILVDPILLEEDSLDAILTIGFDSNSNLVAIQKSSLGMIPENLIEKIILIAKEKADFLRKKLMESIKNG
ncbi:MAG: exosome complex protein Rrp42 [Nitrososphaerota archaeon]